MLGGKFDLAIALDGGTTNTRARLLHHGRVVATSRRSVGVRDTVLAPGRENPLSLAVRDALSEVRQAAQGRTPDVIVAAGMLSSDVGLATVPHVAAPAGLTELARGAIVHQLPEISDQPILFVPGVRTPISTEADGWSFSDVMRGEECETLGAWSLLATDRQPESGTNDGETSSKSSSHSAFVWPGSHTKAVEVDSSGTILRSHSSLAGELTNALAKHTLLAASLPDALPDDPDPAAVAAGARLVARAGLGRAAFLVRVAALSGTYDPHQRASFLIGAVIAEDVAHLSRQALLQSPGRLWVGGRQPQRSLYSRWLREQLPIPVLEIDDETADRASALGALAVAVRYAELGESGVAKPRV